MGRVGRIMPVVRLRGKGEKEAASEGGEKCEQERHRGGCMIIRGNTGKDYSKWQKKNSKTSSDFKKRFKDK